MATAIGRTQCIICAKEKATAKCAGCLQDFCFTHFTDHRQQLNKQLDELEVYRDLFRQTLIQQTIEPKKHPLMQHIDHWEQESIIKIREAAEEARLVLINYTNDHATQLEEKLTRLTEKLLQSRQEDDIIEIDLQNWQDELQKLTEEFIKPSHIIIQPTPIPLINKIHVGIVIAPSTTQNIITNTEWIQNAATVAGGNGIGGGLNQLSDPWSVAVDDDQTIYVAERYNNRILAWKNGATSGKVVAGGNGQGNGNDQLNHPVYVLIDKQTDCLIICDYGNKRVVRWPRQNGGCGETIIPNVSCWGLAMDNEGYLYTSNVNKHEVRRWRIGETTGTVVAGGNGQGSRLDQLHSPYYIFVTDDHSVYVSDCNNHRVVKWKKDARKGTVVAGGHDYGKGMSELSGPYGIVVDQIGTVYIADCNNHRMMCWLRGATEGTIIGGGNGSGRKVNQLNSPCDLAFDRQNNLYVVDNNNHRVQKFNVKLN